MDDCTLFEGSPNYSISRRLTFGSPPCASCFCHLQWIKVIYRQLNHSPLILHHVYVLRDAVSYPTPSAPSPHHQHRPRTVTNVPTPSASPPVSPMLRLPSQPPHSASCLCIARRSLVPHTISTVPTPSAPPPYCHYRPHTVSTASSLPYAATPVAALSTLTPVFPPEHLLFPPKHQPEADLWLPPTLFEGTPNYSISRRLTFG